MSVKKVDARSLTFAFPIQENLKLPVDLTKDDVDGAEDGDEVG